MKPAKGSTAAAAAAAAHGSARQQSKGGQGSCGNDGRAAAVATTAAQQSPARVLHRGPEHGLGAALVQVLGEAEVGDLEHLCTQGVSRRQWTHQAKAVSSPQGQWKHQVKAAPVSAYARTAYVYCPLLPTYTAHCPANAPNLLSS